MNYSIIVCTYNPDFRLFERVLNAIAALVTTGLTTEVILVDNNSTSPLSESPFVLDFLNCLPGSKLILIKEQGLSHARIGGIKASSGSHILFFDDDNEPEKNYLMALHASYEQYPQVAAWGPGTVAVDFIDGVDDRLNAFAKEAFQERNEKALAYSNQRSWQSCYPFGTGLSIKRSYLEAYIALVDAGKFTLSGRKEGKMTSGEDTQMVLYCTSTGAAAGVVPEMKLVHMVPGKRTTLAYLKRLTYGTSICYSTCMLEVFPEHIHVLEQQKVNSSKFLFKAFGKYLLALLIPKPTKILRLVTYIGTVSGNYIAKGIPVPAGIVWLRRKLRID